VIQLTRSGLRVSPPEEVDRLAAVFEHEHAVKLPRFLEPALLDAVGRCVASARFAERVHDHLDPPTIDLGLDDPAVHGRLLVLFNDAGLFRFVEALTGCGPIGGFQGTAYRMVPGQHHLDSWHDDLKESRLVALTLNLSPDGFAGGTLQVRTTDPPAIVHEVANTGYGDAVVFRIGARFEHRVTPVEPGPVKIAWTGWFRRDPAFLDIVHGRHGRSS
jgi:hypothetical protein